MRAPILAFLLFAACQLSADRDDTTHADELRQQGVALFKEKKFAQAAEACAGVAAGSALAAAGKRKDAASRYEQAAKTAAQVGDLLARGEAMQLLGQVLSADGDLEGAEKAFRKRLFVGKGGRVQASSAIQLHWVKE